MYRSIRHNNGPSTQCHTTTLGGSYPYTTSTSHYGPGTSSASSYHHHHQQQQQQQQQKLLQQHEPGQQHSHHHIIGIDDDVYTNPVSNVTTYDDMEDSTSLYSPLAPTSITNMPIDTAVLIARKHRLMSSTSNSQLHPASRSGEMMMDGSEEQLQLQQQQHHHQGSYVGSQAAVVRLSSSSSHKLSSSAYYNESDEDGDYAQIVRCSSGDSTTALHQRSIRKPERSSASINDDNDDEVDDEDQGQEDDADADDDEEDDDDVSSTSNGINKDRRRTNYLENGKRLSQVSRMGPDWATPG